MLLLYFKTCLRFMFHQNLASFAILMKHFSTISALSIAIKNNLKGHSYLSYGQSITYPLYVRSFPWFNNRQRVLRFLCDSGSEVCKKIGKHLYLNTFSMAESIKIY